MLNQHSQHKRQYLTACISFLLTFQTANAAWLNAYGTAEQESATNITKLDAGGYAISGTSGTTNWYGLLDEQGKIVWNKSSGTAHVSVIKDGTVKISQTKFIASPSDSVTIEATGKLDISTGSINEIVVKKNNKISSDGGELTAIANTESTFQGSWNADVNYDVAFAKFDTELRWSHLYTVKGGSNYGSIYPWKTEYLLTLKNATRNEEDGTFIPVYLVTKLDKDGAVIPGSTQKIDSARQFSFISPNALEDGSIVLVSYSPDSKDISLIKLDNNLNYVWGKRFYSADGTYQFLNRTIKEIGNNELEVLSYSHHLDEKNALTEAHPLLIRINASTGEVLSKKETRISQFDPPALLRNAEGSYSLTGFISNTALQAEDSDGLFAQFNNSLQPEWVKTITGSAFDNIYSVNNTSEGVNYLLSGETASWGAGNKDALLGKLDTNGTIANCSAIQSATANIVEADNITVEDIPSPLSQAADPIDKGPFTVKAEQQEYSLDLNPVDYAITTTEICSAADIETVGKVGLSTSVVDFGSVALAQTASQEVVVNNSGTGTLKITSITTPPKPFSVNDDGCTGKTLDAGGSCKISYQFAPTVAGNFSIPLAISSNDPANSSILLTLQGTGASSIGSQPDPSNSALSSTDIGAGSRVTINGNFSNKKGKVKIDNKSARIIKWTSSSIVIKLPAVKAGPHQVTVINKDKTRFDAGKLTVHVPEVSVLNPGIGSKGATVIVNGKYFGTGIKPKAYLLSSDNKRTAVKVLKGSSDTAIKIKIPKLQPDNYGVIIKNSAGESGNSVSFTVN